MKKLIKFLTIALVTGACTCSWAVDYANHFYDQRVYRVALGSGTAPTAADMNTVRMHNGDMVLNTDDNCLYIMHATNVYTKMTSAGTVTLASMSVPLASNKLFIGSSAGVAAEFPASGLFTFNNSGVATNSRQGLAYTNMTASGTLTPLALTNVTVSGGALSGVGVVVTNASNGAVSGVGTSLTQTANSLVVTNATVGGAALSGVSLVMTNALITPALIVTNVTFVSQIITNVYDLQTNIYTIYTGATMETATLTLTKETGTPSVSSPTITLERGSAVQSVSLDTGNITPTLTLQTGTPAVSTVALSLQTVASGAVAVTLTPATGLYVKP